LAKLSDYVAAEMRENDLNIRILKPYSKFYKLVMSTVLKYGLKNLSSVDSEDFIAAVHHSMKKTWREDLRNPVIAFYELCKAESTKEESLAFENVRHKMRQIWETQIIERSNKFEKAKLDQ